MDKLLRRKGLKSLALNEYITYYFDESMLRDRIAFSSAKDPEGSTRIRIAVEYLNDSEAVVYEVAQFNSIEPIQTARILLDLYTVYRESGLRDLLEVIEDGIYLYKNSSSDKSNPENEGLKEILSDVFDIIQRRHEGQSN